MSLFYYFYTCHCYFIIFFLHFTISSKKYFFVKNLSRFLFYLILCLIPESLISITEILQKEVFNNLTQKFTIFLYFNEMHQLIKRSCTFLRLISQTFLFCVVTNKIQKQKKTTQKH